MKDPPESKYQWLINGREKVGTENLKTKGIHWLFMKNWWFLWKFGRL